MVAVHQMRLGPYEFVMDVGAFRYITQSRSGPGWDFHFGGQCVNDDPDEPAFPYGAIEIFTEAASLPLTKAADYTGAEIDLPGFYDEATGEPYFGVNIGESYEVSDVRLRFAARDGSRYRIEMSGTVSELIFGHPERFELSAWADEQPDHAYPV